MIHESMAPPRAKSGKGAQRTQARIDNLKLLIATMGERGEMLRDDIGELLHFTPSGVRKYVAELREASLIELARYADGTATFLGWPVYKLVDDEQRVSEFIASLDAGGVSKRGPGSAKKSQLAVAQRMAGRHFHILSDDTHYAVRVSRTPPFRDPLVAALFGAPRAHQAAQVGA